MNALTASYSDLAHDHVQKKTSAKHVGACKKASHTQKIDWEDRVRELMKAFEGTEPPPQSGKPGCFLR